MDRKVIRGLVYDITKAQFISEYCNGLEEGNENYKREILYLTQNGNWFLHGIGRGYSSDFIDENEDITPFSSDQAYHWLEKHNEVDMLLEYFKDKVKEA